MSSCSMRDFFTSRVIRFSVRSNNSGNDSGDGWGPRESVNSTSGTGIVKTPSMSIDSEYSYDDASKGTIVLYSFDDSSVFESEDVQHVKTDDVVVEILGISYSIISIDDLPRPVDRIKCRVVLKRTV